MANSPYSRFGLGELNTNLGTIRAAGMADVAVSAANGFQSNMANPSLLVYNTTTVFDIGIAGQVKNLKNASQSQTDANANLSYLVLGVPIGKKWSAALALRPFSTVDYEINSLTPLQNRPAGSDATVLNSYNGEGGISELYFGHGVRLAEGLSIGASGSYLFGTITKEASSYVIDTSLVADNQDFVVYSERTKYNDFLFRTGASYRRKLTNKLFMGAGAVYSFQTNLSGDRKAAFERRSVFASTQQETILGDSTSGAASLPSSLRAGLSIDNGDNLSVSAEFYSQQMSKFTSFNGSSELADSYSIALGGEYTPDPVSISSYLKRVTYRAGVKYGNTPYIVNGEQLKDMAITWGATFPLGQSTMYELYQLNTAFSVGRRGTTANGLIQETYFQFSAGFTINSRWFLKRRLE
ncbi:hypothetical protein [Botryobacter ruber]|uniref:hypothetical protein n=1 Tax=Botryobacter ruber TaxID=2171629 RepID=UPI001F0C3810|nr:hypothetical protein [Botryobacter ruber]